MERIKAHVIISGRVQGVCFRLETKHAAEHYGVNGWVKNRPDGRVEAVFEGDKDRVASVIKWCHKGSPMSEVDTVDVTYEDVLEEFRGFEITYSF